MTPAAAVAIATLAAAHGGPSPERGSDTFHHGASPHTPPAEAPAGDRSAGFDLVVPTLHAVALMGVMRATEAVLWPQPFAEPAHFAWHYEQAYTRPPKLDASQPFMRWDGDPLLVNVVGHGLFGSELHLRARQCGLGWAGSLAFATLASGVWEYGFEANGARPSALDLVYTPLAGLVLGEARWAIHRAAGGIGSRAGRAALRAVVDPLGELERAAGAGC